MAALQSNSRSPTIRRILREAAEITGSPSPDYTAEPLESDLFEWHFTIRGPPNSPYAEGIYHGRIVLPPTYPLRPPSFRFTTPNGRFEANREICLSISGHHEETWQPAWGIRTAIVALRSFMTTDAKGQLGGYDASESVRLRLASESTAFRCATCAKSNADIIKECEQRAKEAEFRGEDVHVPEELNLAFKDELTATNATDDQKGEDAETAEIAEGFVQTIPIETQSGHTNSGTTATPDPLESSNARARLTTRRPSSPSRSHPPTATQSRAPPLPTEEGVPVWLDRLIVLLVIVLAALFLKILFTFR